MLKALIASASMCIMVACSTATEPCTAVNQDRIHQSLSASYDAETDQSSARAQFRFGDGSGTTLEMAGNCAIVHDTFILNKSTFLGASYSGEKSGFVPAHVFTFTDDDSKAFVNSGTITTIAFTRSAPTSISKGTPVTVGFSDALGANESVTLHIAGEGNKFASASTSTNGATSVTISAEDMKFLSAGPAEIYLTRSKTDNLTQAASAGGNFSVSYSTAHQTTTITE